uniref:peptidylprolyl isomerase n=1 Tax=Globisporangium ultimum (strain ATCC 200006 / CBS 805.95 / DAOM BR144) TaxID=431595 RepID=K3WUH7_GLOUD
MADEERSGAADVALDRDESAVKVHDTQQLLKMVKRAESEVPADALWLASLRELAARCQDPSISKLLQEEQIVAHLLALTLNNKKKLQLARWQALTTFVEYWRHDAATQCLPYETLQCALKLSSHERFASKGVLMAIAEFVVVLALSSHPDQVNLLAVEIPPTEDDADGDFSYLALIKQMYVTLDNFAIRQQLVEVLLKLVETKDDVKALVRSGMVRSMLQVAIDHSNSSAASLGNSSVDALNDIEDGDEGEQTRLSDDLMLGCAKVFTHMATFVCYDSSATSLDGFLDPAVADYSSEQFVCKLVVQLMLSRVSLVFEEAVRLLQMLVENATLYGLLVQVMDLRGALEKAHTLVQLQENNVLRVAYDPYVLSLCKQQFQQLFPEIDAFERLHGSLVGLPADPDLRYFSDDSGRNSAFALASECKERGNWFFKRGNFSTARTFYRRAVSILRMVRLQRDQDLATLTKDQVLEKCSAGASVLVQTLSRQEWRPAMVSDVEDGQVEVIYDDDDSEDVVGPSRVRLRMNTTTLDTFENLEVDCSMNMGKAFSRLQNYERAVESFTHVLAIKKQHHAAALYHRGIAHMALHDLKNAQQDLWNANQLCRKLKGEQALRKQVIAAYSKLQQLHANKKKMDKKIIKQMMKYLSTIPGIQEE